MNIPYSPTNPGTEIAGKVSWFGGPNDASDSGHTASGVTTAEPGIAVYNRATLGGYWQVTDKRTGKTAVLKQTDLGPSPSTGRSIDVTYSAIPQFGYTQQNFPTDGQFTAKYLGHTPSRAAAHTGAHTSSVDAAVGKTLAPAAATAAPVQQDNTATLLNLLNSSKNAYDLGQPKVAALAGLDPTSSLRAAGLLTPVVAAPSVSPTAAPTTSKASVAPNGSVAAGGAVRGTGQTLGAVSAGAPTGLVAGSTAKAGLSQMRAPGKAPSPPSTFAAHAKPGAMTDPGSLPLSQQANLYEHIPSHIKNVLAQATSGQLEKFGYMRLPGGAIVKRPGGAVKAPVKAKGPSLAAPLNQGLLG